MIPRMVRIDGVNTPVNVPSFPAVFVGVVTVDILPFVRSSRVASRRLCLSAQIESEVEQVAGRFLETARTDGSKDVPHR